MLSVNFVVAVHSCFSEQHRMVNLKRACQAVPMHSFHKNTMEVSYVYEHRLMCVSHRQLPTNSDNGLPAKPRLWKYLHQNVDVEHCARHKGLS